jgi:hypothetical protein
MKSPVIAVVFLVLGWCLGNSWHLTVTHAQVSQQASEIEPRSELVEEVNIQTGGWVPNFKGAMRAISLSCVPQEHGAKCYVLLQSK